MESLILSSPYPYLITECNRATIDSRRILFMARADSRRPYRRKLELPKNLRYPRRTKIPPDFHPDLRNVEESFPESDPESSAVNYSENDISNDCDDENVVWESDEIEAISSLFKGRVPQKPGKLNRERPLPLPLPHKLRPLGFPTHKKLLRTDLSSFVRQPLSSHIYKNPTFLIGLAREIKSLPLEDNVSVVLNHWARFLRKGSLSLTIRELGHMGLPARALHVFCWAQNQPHLFPDDRILASTVEVLARAHELKMPFDLDKFIGLASQGVHEAMIRGFIKGGSLKLAWKLVSSAMDGKRTLDAGVYAKLILELGKNPDKRMLVLSLLEELANRDDLQLTQQDCTAIMKICIKLGKFDVVEALYVWFKKINGVPSVVMYTTLIHSRYSERRYREAMDVVWEMEGSNCLFDLPAYRVVIKLFVALNDLSRAARYFSKLKESGFSPTVDIYRELIKIYMVSGRLAKCKEVCREAEVAGLQLDQQTQLSLLQLE